MWSLPWDRVQKCTYLSLAYPSTQLSILSNHLTLRTLPYPSCYSSVLLVQPSFEHLGSKDESECVHKFVRATNWWKVWGKSLIEHLSSKTKLRRQNNQKGMEGFSLGWNLDKTWSLVLHHLIWSGIIKSGFRSQGLYLLVGMVRSDQAKVGHGLVFVGMVR